MEKYGDVERIDMKVRVLKARPSLHNTRVPLCAAARWGVWHAGSEHDKAHFTSGAGGCLCFTMGAATAGAAALASSVWM